MVLVTPRKGRAGSPPHGNGFLGTIAMGCILGIMVFYLGFLIGSTSKLFTSEKEVQRRIEEGIKNHILKLKLESTPSLKDDTASRFPPSVQGIATGVARVPRAEFATTFDMGVPLDPDTPQNNEVLIFYSSDKAHPKDLYKAAEAASQTTIPTLSSREATANCEYLNVILTDFSNRKQCVALFGQYEAFHIQKFMRLPEEGGKLDASAPLRLVNRGAQASGRKSTKPPSKEDTIKYWEILRQYLDSLDSVLAQLKPIAEKVAVNNSIVVLVCNLGQSELLLNFICAARSKGIGLKGVLVFATDEETRDLAIANGVAAFYDETNFGSMPKEAAGRYADSTFTSMMLAKVYCVQMISMLGYDILFQDVDIVWHQNPLDFFHDTSNPSYGFDAYFQDDGNHGLFYAPYSANTGFYYIRNNDKTVHFFNSFLMSGDLIFATHSHQVPLVALLTEHASMYGLRVKIFARTENEFPGGHAFHRRKELMKDIIAGIEKPYIFHMSWTHSKENKIKFFQQLGEWYVHGQCVQQPVAAIAGADADQVLRGDKTLLDTCCVREPVVVCHYRDKPSKIPCKEFPPIDNGKPSFW